MDPVTGDLDPSGRNKVGIIAASDAFGQRLARHARKRLAQFGITPEELIAEMGDDEEDWPVVVEE